MIVLDSTFLIQILRQDRHALKLLEALGTKPLATTVINQFELYIGDFINKRLAVNENSQEVLKKG